MESYCVQLKKIILDLEDSEQQELLDTLIERQGIPNWVVKKVLQEGIQPYEVKSS